MDNSFSIKVGSIVAVDVESIIKYNLLVRMGGTIFVAPDFFGDYKDKNFLLIKYRLSRGRNSYFHVYELLHGEQIYDFVYGPTSSDFNPNQFLKVFKSPTF